MIRTSLSRLLATFFLSLTIALTGCSEGAASSSGSYVPDSPDTPAVTTAEEPVAEPAAEEPAAPETGYLVWNASDYPDYYTVVGTAQYDPSVAPGTESYSPLDGYGRATGVLACITGAQRAEARAADRDSEDISDIEPSGWPQDNQIVTIPGVTQADYRGYFWNRSHLLAFSLGGDPVRENLVTGTRPQNVGQRDNQGGMAWCENAARDYLDAHPGGWLYYRAVPAYEGSDPICRGVWVDMRSDDGSIDVRVFVFNATNGYEVDYTGASSTGWSSTSVPGQQDAQAAPATTQTQPEVVQAPSATQETKTVVITPTGEKYHLPGCRTLSRSKTLTELSEADAMSRGYEPCKVCNP